MVHYRMMVQRKKKEKNAYTQKSTGYMGVNTCMYTHIYTCTCRYTQYINQIITITRVMLATAQGIEHRIDVAVVETSDI